MPDDLMTVREAAAEFRCSERAIRSGLVAGCIQRHYHRAAVLVSRAQMAAWRAAVRAQKHPGRSGRKSGKSA